MLICTHPQLHTASVRLVAPAYCAASSSTYLLTYLLTTYLQALQDDATVSDLEELSLKLNAVEVAHYKALEAATPEPKELGIQHGLAGGRGARCQ